ncbi:GT2 family glycosyltransferase [Sphingobium sp. B2D3A]|uniref:glycosyltransferase family 2 protein n=1 Tax=unclassified Sphingobium TaxID=2611147 RepID=UPI0022247473|nr:MULTISPECIES: glycosyltransferase family 2 protein [unclassified Sphingobium]MCW2338498.1 GT2 family glycosyltransferase [Sphingobium sp. B2D3A]MCW2384956.1 GT2 family glycosyltransferase [Sphingobium sp. B2D3D]
MDVIATKATALQRAWLTARVHVDAFRASPRIYIAALWWRLFRRRVRSRAMLEPLLGASSRAYLLWQIRNDETATCIAAPTAKMVIGLDVSHGESGLSNTLASLEQASGQIDVIRLGRPGLAPPPIPELPFWLIPLLPGDRLAASALAAYSAAAARSQATIIYADDDLCDERGWRYSPHFKPRWNEELFRWHDYLSHACAIRIDEESELKDIAERENWLSQLIRQRIAANPASIEHVPQVLHHRRLRPEPRPPQIRGSDDRNNDLPSTTVIVPTRNRVELLRTCLEGLQQTAYPRFDVIVIDNDSDDPATLAYLKQIQGLQCRVMAFHGPFNYAAMNNAAVTLANCELICFLNNDIEMLDTGWLTYMAHQAVKPGIGAVGARLLYADGSIQHAGVSIGVGGGAAHAHRYLRPEDEGYFSRHNLPQFTTAVTAACLLVRCDYFRAVGGFDEQRFPVAFNDVDLCLKLNERGWQSFYEPRATLIHHESKSRGKDSHHSNRTRFAAELAALKERWHTDTAIDPYHHPSLSRYSEQFVLKS